MHCIGVSIKRSINSINSILQIVSIVMIGVGYRRRAAPGRAGRPLDPAAGAVRGPRARTAPIVDKLQFIK